MKRLFLLILMLCMATSLTLTSCKDDADSEDNTDDSSDNTTDTSDDNDVDNGADNGVDNGNHDTEDGGSDDSSDDSSDDGSVEDDGVCEVWNKFSEIYVIFPEGATWKSQFYDDFLFRTDIELYPTNSANAKREHEIVIGPSDRAVSLAAYRLLDRNIGEEDDAEGYVIYALDGSVAIAYSSETARMEAVSAFLSSYALPELRAENGYLDYGFYNLIEKAEADRAALREEHFLAIEESHGKEIADALRLYYDYFDTENYVWIANLFDPETGGFYFSNSGRDNIGFLPDLESVYQAYMSLRVGGMFEAFGDSTSLAIPKSIQETTVKWIQGLQSPDGFFYHPQWGDNIATARRGRDLEWAESLLKSFGGRPYYDTPGGMVGIGAPAVGTASYTTDRLGASVVGAVSRVTETASNLPTHLQSLDAWAAYIDGLNIWQRSYHAGNTLAAEHTLIKRAGDEYVDYLLDYLDELQNPELGVWGSFEDEAEPGRGAAYQAYYLVNGVMKISTLYGNYGRPMPNVQATMDSTMRVALYDDLPELNETACYVYNPWVVMSQLINSERKVNGNDAAEALREQVLERAAELIEASTKKMLTHVVEGGGFSYTELLPCNTSQGVPVACAVEPEADLNANTLYISSTVDAMFATLGIEKVPVWCSTDYYYFIDVLTALGPTVKREIYIPDVEPISFDDYVDEGKNTEKEFYPHEEVYIKTIDSELFKPNVVPDPETGLSTNKVLRAETIVKKDENGNDVTAKGPSPAFVHFSNSMMDGNCFIYETDIRIESFEKENHPILQMFFTNLAMSYVSAFNLSMVEHKGAPALRISDTYGGLDGKSNANIYTGGGLNEWINLRFELYRFYTPVASGDAALEDETLTNLDVRIKIFVNGEYVYTSDSGRIAATKPDSVVDSKIDQILLSHYRTNSSVIYYDNIYVAKSNQKYEEVKIYDPEVPNIPDTPVDTDTDHIYVAEFDNGILNDAYLHSYVPDGGHVNVMAPNIDLNDYKDRIKYSLVDNVGDRVSTVLKVETVKQSKYVYGQSSVKVSNTKPEGSTATFEMKVYFEDAAKNTTFTQLFFKSKDKKKLASINFVCSDKGYIYLSENNASEGDVQGTGANVSIPGAYLPVDRWVTIRFVFFQTGSADTTRMKIYTDAGDGSTMRCISDIPCYSPAAISNPKEIMQVDIAHQRTATLTSYFDDVYLTRTALAYEAEQLYPLCVEDVEKPVVIDPQNPESPIIPDVDIEDGVDYNYVAEFDEGKINDGFLHNYVINGTTYLNALDPSVDLDDYADRISYSLAENIGGRVGAVLKVSPVYQEQHGYSKSTVKLSNTVKIGSTATFEAKMYYTDASGNALLTQLNFLNTDYKLLVSLNVQHHENGYIFLSENNAGGTGANKQISGAFLPTDRWFTLRIEFYYTGEADTTRMKIYTDAGDGETMKCISDFVTYAPAAVTDAQNIRLVDICHMRKAPHTLYLDDVSLTRTEKAYEEGAVDPLTALDVLNKTPAPDEPEDAGDPFDVTVGFEDGSINNDYFITTVGSLTALGTDAGKDSHDPIDAGDSQGGNLNTYLELRDDVPGRIGDLVLHITQNASEKDNYNYTTTVIKETSGPAEGDIYTLRMDVMFDRSDVAATVLLMQMFFENQNYTGLNVFALPSESDGVYLSFGYEYNVKNYIPYGEWVTVEIVYEAPIRGEESDYNMHFFIKSSKTGGELKKVYTATSRTNSNLMTKPDYMKQFYIMHYKSGEGSYYLDNITFTRTAENANLYSEN